MRDELLPAEAALWAAGSRRSAALEELRDRARGLGLWAVGLPTDLGGQGIGFVDLVRLNELIGWSDWGQYALGTVSYPDCMAIDRSTCSDVVRGWVESLANGTTLPSVAMTEPDSSGSDPTLIKTVARRDGSAWRIDGEKWFVTDAADVDHVLTFCRTGDESTRSHAALTAFVVPTDSAGFEIVREIPTMGEPRSGCYHVRLTGVLVSNAHIVGDVGSGFAVAQGRLTPGRLLHCSRWVGMAERAFAALCERAQTRFSHKSMLADKGEIQRYVAQSAAEIYAARALVRDVADRYVAQTLRGAEVSLLKVVVAETLNAVIDRAVQVWGAAGVSGDTPLERMLRRARFARIIDGPDELHRAVAARRILSGYPMSVPWSDVAALMHPSEEAV